MNNWKEVILWVGIGICAAVVDIFAQELPDPPPPPEAISPAGIVRANTSNSPTASISIPEILPLGSYTQCDIRGISLEDVTKGKVILRVYPQDRVEVRDGISFIKRVPYLVLHPQEVGEYTLVFIVLSREGKLTFIESEFKVVE